MFLSIIIPHKNDLDRLKRLVATIPNEKEIEIIIVDDHSEREVFKNLIEEYVDQPNVSISANDSKVFSAGKARNIGLKEAIGEWIMFADADDFFVEDWFAKVEKFKNSKEDLIFFKPTSFDERAKEQSNRHILRERLINNYLANASIKNEMELRSKFYEPWSKMIRHSLIKENKIDFDETRYSNDQKFSTKIGILANQIYASSEIIYCVVKSTNSLTTQVTEESIITRFEVYTEVQKYLRATLSKKKYRFARGTTLYWYETGIRNRFSFKYFKMITNKTIKYKLPLRVGYYCWLVLTRKFTG